MVSTRSATASSPRRPRSSLSASHAILYPVNHTLGVRGTKKDKRRQINQMWRENLEIHSPYPHFSARLPSNHRGHDLTGPILNTNKNAGGYRQVCVGCSQARCLPANRKGKRGGKTAVFCIRAGLPLHTLQSGMLGRLARARAELQPVSRAAARAARAAGATTNTSPSSSVTVSTLPPSSSPSISASSRATTPDASISTLSHDNAPDALIVSHAAGAAIDTEHATAPSTPRHRGLTGFFGGYGGVHYSPEGYIINHSADHDDAVHVRCSRVRAMRPTKNALRRRIRVLFVDALIEMRGDDVTMTYNVNKKRHRTACSIYTVAYVARVVMVIVTHGATRNGPKAVMYAPTHIAAVPMRSIAINCDLRLAVFVRFPARYPCLSAHETSPA
ncbi:hypothetical protein B0H14DRAFT_2572872 [Mycena olivaceomarginata]|nr:hypothetical protein B0H14DRAFT_2572872 [Mycena olivaceomarginata]